MLFKNPLTKYLDVDPNQVLRIDKQGRVYLGEHLMSKQEIKSLQEEIKFIEKSQFWNIIMNSLPEQAKRIMFEKSETFDDMKTGKAMLRNLDIIDKLKDLIKSLKV
jgi:hypothetical protein